MSAPHLVLVVEDDPATAEFLALALRAMGHEVVIAADGQQAVELAAEQPPQLALVDALLPKLDGFGVLRELRKANPSLPVVMMSGIYQKRSYVQDAQDQGAREYIFKPVSVLKIWELAERYLGEVAAGTREPEGLAGTPLSERPLACALGELHAEAKTGMLFVRGPEGTAILFVEDGRIIFGRSNDPQTRLDRVLDKQGKLSADAKRRTRELLDKAKGRARFGDLLVENGLLSQEDLQAALAQQQRMHVTRPLTWTEGQSQFFASEAPRHESFKLELDMESLVVWAARHVPQGPALEAWLPTANMTVSLQRDLQREAERFSLSDAEVQLLSLADGSRTVGALRAMGRLAQVEVDRLLAAFCSLGLMTVRAANDAPKRIPGAAANSPAAGAVKAHPPARVLLGTGLAGKTGALSFEDGESRRTVWFDRGCIAFANSNDPHDRLGQVLLRAGFVNNEQLRAALEASKQRPGTAIGRILVDQGTLSLDDLHGALVAQVREVVAGLVCWQGGTFNFTTGPLPTQEIVPLALDPLELVLASLRATPFSALVHVLPDREARLRKTWQCFELAAEIDLTQLEDQLLGALDQNPRVGGLLDAVDESAEAALRGVHLLLSLGLIEVDANAVTAQASGEAVAMEEGFGDESFGDEDFESAPADDGFASDGDGFGDEGFGDESFGEAAQGEDAAPSFDAPVTGGEDSFAGLADEPALSGLIQAGSEQDPQPDFGNTLADAEQSFAGLADEELLSELVQPGSGQDPQPDFQASAPAPSESSGFGDLLAEEMGGAGVFDGELRGETGFTNAVETESPGDFALVGDEHSLGGGVELGGELAAAFADLEGSAPAASARSATATATLEAPLDLSMQTFLALLADHLRTHPGSLPDHVLAALPPELRERFGL